VNVTVPGDDAWLDGDAGRLVRPYTVSAGRTNPSKNLDLLSMVVATGDTSRASLEPDHVHILSLCHQPASVAEIAARVRLPAIVTKVLLSDLVDCGAVMAGTPRRSGATDPYLLEKVLDGLQRRL
jgi:hypothetical protein